MSTPRIMVLGDDAHEARAALEALGLEAVRRDPEVVLCHGGDGTLLRAERLLPRVPKLPVRIARHTRHCPDHDVATMLGRLLAGDLAEESLPRLLLQVGRARFHAINDVVLRNDNPALAVRFKVTVDGTTSEVLTGDGLVIATPFGSTGYYRSITRSSFREGLGVAFNNATVERPPLLLGGSARLDVELTRGPAVLVHDNDTRTLGLRAGHAFSVRRDALPARVLGLDALRCQRCRRQDDGRFNPH